MIYNKAVFLAFVILQQFFIANAKTDDDDDPELVWSNAEGNSQNTRRIVPSMATHYSKLPWIYEYNSTIKNIADFSLTAGINGDLYFFLSKSIVHEDGTVRWEVDIEFVTDMISVGVSNIVSDRQGDLFYTISWINKTDYVAKVCHITNAQTSHPVQKCIVNNQLLFYVNTPLVLIENYDILVTAASKNVIESVPLALNKTTLDVLWVSQQFLDAGMHGNYRSDFKTGDFFWIGKDDYLVKFNYTGEMLINNSTQLTGFKDDFVIDRHKEIIVQSWHNKTGFAYKLIVSSYDVSTEKIKLRWNWYAPSTIADNVAIPLPTIDKNSTVYMSSMPLAFAIDNDGKTLWTSELATPSEMNKFELFSYCIAMNGKQRILYIVSGSSYLHEPRLYFITAVHMDTGKIIKRIDLNVGNTTISPKCPILIGDEMLYFSWFIRDDQQQQLSPFKVMGIQQFSSII